MASAETIVYPGQPFAPLGGGQRGQIQSLATNPRTVSEIIRSESALAAASEASGVPVSKLRSSVSTKELTAVGQARGVNSWEIAVKGASGRTKAEPLPRRSLRAWSRRLQLRLPEGRALESQGRGQQPPARGRHRADPDGAASAGHPDPGPVDPARPAPPAEREPQSSVITTADARRTSLQDDLHEARQLLNLAESVESSRVVEPPRGVKTTARSSRTSLLVGALVGLLVGAVAALAAEPFVARRRRATASG